MLLSSSVVFTASSDSGLDNISLKSASRVPEPSTLTLLSIGSLGLLGYGWRRRNLAAA